LLNYSFIGLFNLYSDTENISKFEFYFPALSKMSDYFINIVNLSSQPTVVEYDLGENFIETYGNLLFQNCDFKAKVTLFKQETLIEAHIQIKGFTKLICDRSLEEFDYLVNVDKKLVFKYGKETKEITDDLIMISYGLHQIEIGQYFYELIGIQIPIKKLHPKYAEQDVKGGFNNLVYSTKENKKENKNQLIDPRWEKLKNLN